MTGEFGERLVAEIPGLRRYARVLTQDPAIAEDLVQDCLLRALVKQHLWQPGSNLRAWLFTMLHNRRVSDRRRGAREREHLALLPPPANQDLAPGPALIDLERAFARLPERQRRALLLVGLEGVGYDRAAAVLSAPPGTVRSRVARARAGLRLLLDDGGGRTVPIARPEAGRSALAA